MSKSLKQFAANKQKEYYYREAKRIEVRARSFFKLEQLDNKFELIKEGQTIIDLGCAPGGWLQFIDAKIKKAKIIGIDLLEVKKQTEFSDNVQIIEDDFAEIEHYVKQKFDLVLSDMAPEFSGDSRVDRGRAHKLNVMTLDFCKAHLNQGGNCAFKTFGGEDLDFVRNLAKKIFKEVKEYKPNSSQKKSSEMFIICFNKL
jgi:23S rRNA (uridine2552-2'-O)-methyltransferase